MKNGSCRGVLLGIYMFKRARVVLCRVSRQQRASEFSACGRFRINRPVPSLILRLLKNEG